MKKHDRAWIVVWLGAVLAAVATLVILLVAEGEARGHGIFHFLFGSAALALLSAIVWASPRAGARSANRSILLVVLFVSSAAAFLESIGAAGYDEFNDGQRIEWLTTLHGVSSPIAGLSLLAIPVAAVTLAIALVERARNRRRANEALSRPGARH